MTTRTLIRAIFSAMSTRRRGTGVRARRPVADGAHRRQVVEADVQSVEVNEALVVNGRSPFVVRCQWQNPMTHEVHVFQSGHVWFDPSEHLERGKVWVQLEVGNPGNYLVDLSFLPKLGR